MQQAGGLEKHSPLEMARAGPLTAETHTGFPLLPPSPDFPNVQAYLGHLVGLLLDHHKEGSIAIEQDQ